MKTAYPQQLSRAKRVQDPVIQLSADDLARSQTSFASFKNLVDAAGGYFPSLDVSDERNLKLADLYDNAQLNRRDPRRAFRYR